MPSLFRATISLYQHQWEYHKANPGRISRICQKAVDREMAIEALPESIVDQASEAAGKAFFDRYHLEGAYAVENDSLIQHEATEAQMASDAASLGVPVERLLAVLDELYGIEWEAAMLRAAAIRATGPGDGLAAKR